MGTSKANTDGVRRRSPGSGCARSCKENKAPLAKKLTNFKKADAIPAATPRQFKDGFETYDKLTDADRNALKGLIHYAGGRSGSAASDPWSGLSMAQNRNPTMRNEPSRRRLPKGIGAASLAARWPSPAAVRWQQCGEGQQFRGRCRRDARAEAQFTGSTRPACWTPQQASMMLVAFDVLASDKADLERLLRLLTSALPFLTRAARRRTRQIRGCRRWIPASSARGSPRITRYVTVSVVFAV